MQGYVYLDNDRNLNFRTKEYIEVRDPVFWSRNAAFIDTVWKVDSEDEISMRQMLEGLKRRELRAEDVRLLCQQIDFDLDAFIARNAPAATTGFSSVSR